MEYAGNNEIGKLLRYLNELRVKDYILLSEKISKRLSNEEIGEIRLTTAQLKMLAFDESFLEDCYEAKRLLPPRFSVEPVMQSLEMRDANCFILFSTEKNSLSSFKKSLIDAKHIMRLYTGDYGYFLCNQIISEIDYFRGEFSESISRANEIYKQSRTEGEYKYTILSGYTLLRCYLAVGRIDEVTKIIEKISEICEITRDPNLDAMKNMISSWFRLTTGCKRGETRFIKKMNGRNLPNLYIRTNAMETGFASLGPAEEPFSLYAKGRVSNICTMREFYSDIYNLMMEYYFGNQNKATELFNKLYRISYRNKILMPFAEYGHHFVVLLGDLVKKNENVYDSQWVDEITHIASNYEDGINHYIAKYG